MAGGEMQRRVKMRVGMVWARTMQVAAAAAAAVVSDRSPTVILARTTTPFASSAASMSMSMSKPS